jgi:hypothetical protein
MHIRAVQESCTGLSLVTLAGRTVKGRQCEWVMPIVDAMSPFAIGKLPDGRSRFAMLGGSGLRRIQGTAVLRTTWDLFVANPDASGFAMTPGRLDCLHCALHCARRFLKLPITRAGRRRHSPLRRALW